jgi:hypothetical protein
MCDPAKLRCRDVPACDLATFVIDESGRKAPADREVETAKVAEEFRESQPLGSKGIEPIN